MDTNTIYKNVNDIQKLLASVLATFPSVYLSDIEENNVDLNTMILQPLIVQSNEFCTDLSSGKLLFKPNVKGVFGEVGDLQLRNGTSFDNVMLNHISVGPDTNNNGIPSYVVYHMPIIVKKSNKAEPYYIVLENFNGRYMFIMNNALHEAMIASFASHLYDMGICPGVLKAFGNYACEAGVDSNGPPVATKNYHSYMVLEKSSITLFQLIRDRAYEKVFLNMNVFDFINIIVQVAHTLYVLKRHFGIVPFDLHTKNIMLSYIKKGGVAVPGMPEDKFIKMYYGGKDMNSVEQVCYEIPELGSDGRSKQILVQNNGFMVKIIDYCLAISEFDVNTNKKKFGFPLEKSITDKVYWLGDAIKNSDKYATVAMNYFLYNLVTSLYRTYHGLEGTNQNGINMPPRDQKVRDHAHKLSEDLKPIIHAINPSFSFNKVSQRFSPRIDGQANFDVSSSVKNFADISEIVQLRDVGEPSDNKDEVVLKRIWSYLYNSDFNFAYNTTYVSRNGMRPAVYDETPCLMIPYATDTARAKKTGFVSDLTPMEKFMNLLYKYNSMCLDSSALKFGETATQLKVKWDGSTENRNEICTGFQVQMSTWDPRNRAGKSWASDDVTNKSLIFDPSTGGIKKGITEGNLRKAGFMRGSMAHDLSRFYLEIYPSRTATDSEMNFKIEPYQVFHAGSQLPKKVGDFVDKVNINLIYYTNQNMEVVVGSRDNPFKASTNVLDHGKGGAILAGGLYVTKENMQPLTPDVTAKDFYHPIGFFYSANDLRWTGAPVPLPNGYRKDFAVVAVVNNQFVFMKYNDFEVLHETVRRPYNLYLKDKNGEKYVWKSSESAIRVEKGRPIMRGGKPVFYQAAMTLGPILVWEGNTVFSKEKMMKEGFQVDLTTEWSVESKDQRPLRNKNIVNPVEQGQSYALYEGAATNSMYFTEVGENADDPYKLRNSNKVTSYSCLCQTYDGRLLYLSVDGNGIGSEGLDRVQFARLVSHFNVRYAVGFGQGQVANAVYRDAGHSAKWLSPNVYTSAVGLLIAIRQKKMEESKEE